MEYQITPIEIEDAPLNEMERAVFAHWQSVRDGAFAPSWSRFRLEDLPPKAVPWCSVVDVLEDPLDFVVRFWGSARRDLYGHEITGKRLSTGNTNPVSGSMSGQNALVVDVRAPKFFRAFARREGGFELEYGFLRMPLSDDGTRVTKIFSISYYPELKDELHNLHGTLPPYGNTVIPLAKKSG
jgi:hypothetical protein